MGVQPVIAVQKPGPPVLPGNVHALASCDIGEKFAVNLSVPLSLLLSTAQIQRPGSPILINRLVKA